MALGAKPPASTLPHSKSFFAPILGVLYAPRTAFHVVASTARWKGVLSFTFVMTAIASAMVLETEVGRYALLDWWEQTALTFGQQIDDRQYAALAMASEQGWLHAVASALVTGPVLTVGLSACLGVAFRNSTTPPVRYQQVLTVVAHAGVILAVRQMVTATSIYLRDTLASPLTLGALFSGLDEISPAAQILGALDLFVLWWIIVLAVGTSVLYQRPAPRLAVAFLGTYVAIAAIIAAAAALTGGTS
jgi:hypothetical protein